MAQNSSANGAESLAVAAASTAGPSVQPAVVLSFAGRLKEYAAGVVRQGKPWSEVVDRTAFSRPQNLAEATSRLKKNVAYFRINYLIIVIMAITVCMLMNPGSLMVLCTLLVAWIYVFVIRTTPLVIANQPLSDEMKLMGMAVISFIVIFFLTSVGAVVFGALSIGFCLIALHGATRVPDDLFLDDTEVNQNLMSILMGGKQMPSLSSNV
ncbi:unnamed protein product [Ostreobium quekettii]|uniref:PRA1 family protein n=1 Tax=Ostreobium quekettii TaxID=121088 RepID=A0A8S1IKQ5_9CHLO|nr:unnamed protein product [Ostreobium quekettii]